MKNNSTHLNKLIRNRIQKYGPIPFRDFMELALYHHESGYYVRGPFPGGCKGDFVTSPHTHALFGSLISRQIMQMRDILGTAEPFILVEMGAGAGWLARDILSYLKAMETEDLVEYIIIEPGEKSRSLQRQLLGHFEDKIRWVQKIEEIESLTGCFLSNELLDAFAVHVIEKTDCGFREIYVDADEQGLKEVTAPLSSAGLRCYVGKLPESLPVGYRSEVNLEMKSWIRDISGILRRGFVVTIDYGHTFSEYFHPARNRGTLLAYKDQRVKEDLLSRPGEQDLTAHVNFSDLHRWGMDAGLETVGYAHQWSFLAGLDVEDTLKQISGGNIDPFSPELQAVKMLLFPQGMGESHKVLVQSKGVGRGVQLKGFSLQNMKQRL